MANFVSLQPFNLAAVGQAIDTSKANALAIRDAERKETVRNTLAQHMPKALAGDETALAAITAADPSTGTQIMTHRATTADRAERQRNAAFDRAAKEAPYVARALAGVKDQASYDQARQGLQAMGVDTAKMPPMYAPALVQRMVSAAGELEKFGAPVEATDAQGRRVFIRTGDRGSVQPVNGFTPAPKEYQASEVTRLMRERDALPANDPRRATYDQAIHKATTTERTVQPTEVSRLIAERDRLPPDDPNRATYDAAIAKASTSANMTITSDGKGGTTVSYGRSGGKDPNAMTTKTVGEIEERQLNASEALARLADMEKGFKPEYQTIATKGGMAWNNAKELLGRPLDPKDQQALGEFTRHRQVTTTNLNKTIKDLTGSAMGVQEADRIISTMPNAGQGLFDGDGPTVYKAKLDGALKDVRHAIIRMSWARKHGVDPLKSGVGLDDVPALMNRRGEEIEREVRAALPTATPEQVRMERNARVAQEFGLSH